MNGSADPRTVVFGAIAVFAAITVGIPLAAARSEAVIPLLSECPPLLLQDLSGAALYSHAIVCGLGFVLFLSVPGMIGVGLMVFRAR